MRARHLLIVAGIALSGTAACSIPSSDFQASSDGGSTDAPPAQLALVVSDNAIMVGEGANKDFTVSLNRAPGATVTVEVTTASKKIALQSPELTFDDSNWSTAQTETVSGLQDPDTQDEMAEVDLAATGVTGVDMKKVDVTVKDDDVVTIVTDKQVGTQLQIDEGSQLDIHVHLGAQPSQAVVVTANVSNGPMWANPPSLTFQPSTYDQDQTFTITAPKDANTISEMQDLSLTADNVATVAFHLLDVDKDMLNIKTDVTSLIVNEQGTPGTVQVSLTQQPASDVVVNLTTDTGKVSLDQTQLTFTSANYSAPQPVHVTGLADPDTIDDSDTIHLNATGLIEKTVPVTIHDDDTQAILDSVTGTFSVTENQTKTFDVWLAYQPQVDTQVSITSLAPSVATATPGVLTFTKANYDQHQQVTVKGTKDNNLVTDTTTIQLSEATIGTTNVAVSVPDADQQQILVSTAPISLLEPNSTTVNVSLMYDPGGTVTVNAVSHDVGVTVTPSLSFDSSSYQTPKPLTIAAVNDPDANSIDTTVDVSSTGATTQTIPVHVTDKDTLAIQLDQTGTVIIPEGQSVDVKAHLTAKPNASVTVQVLIPTGSTISVTPTSATFSTTNYGTDQTFHFTAANDANTTDEDNNITFHSTTAGIQDVALDLHEQDKDHLGILVDKTTLTLTEGGASGSINVSLSNQPSSTIMVNLSASNGAVTLGSTSLSFTTSNWSSPQSVSVTAPSDPNTVNGSSVITISSSSVTGTPPTVNVTTLDTDVQAILTDATSLSTAENGNTQFHVWLAYQPVANTTVSIQSLDTSVATVSTGSLTFTTSNYGTKQLVTVTGVHDNNLVTNNTTITASEPTIGTVSMPVSVSDIDTQKIVLSPSSQSINEGSSSTFAVSLAFDPGGSVSVGLASSSPAITLGQASASFSSSNYSTPVQVTLNAPVDSNTTSETSTITATGAGAPAATITATVNDLTVLAAYGWPTYLGQSGTYFSGAVTAYKIHVDVATTLDKLGVYAGSAGGDLRIALYKDGGNIPGTLEVDSGARASISKTGANEIDIVDHPLAAGYYWIAFRVDPQASLGTGNASQTGQVCGRNVDLPNLDDPWPTTFGAATCTTASLTNIYALTYHQ